MRKVLLLTAVGLLAFTTTSCFKKVKEARQELKEAKDGFGNLKKMAKEAQNMQQDMEKLAELEPLTSEDFKNWMPDEVAGMKRTGYKNNVAGYANIASSEATYKSEDGEKQLNVQVIDGAGSLAGFAIAGYRMVTKMDMEEQNEYGHTKTLEKKGIKAQEKYRKYDEGTEHFRENTELMFLHDDRFGIEVKGKNMSPDEVWNALDDLKLNRLSKAAK